MATIQEYISLLNPVIDSFKDRYGVTSLSIFGSTARGDNRPDSDVDIIVDMPPRIFLISGLQDFLENLLRVPVDLHNSLWFELNISVLFILESL